ncbi:hypothetical protein M0811_05508 [Anaeramoeba ignava]|uniref:Uncharacterized protein n=1 Tax=Anaeramoeba ignava TaxID=1746090 RepID=A0A9Q0RFL0_ANAIG|nr:hypothetical protein M0811_05508 [Anaeramoeba ignava]
MSFPIVDYLIKTIPEIYDFENIYKDLNQKIFNEECFNQIERKFEMRLERLYKDLKPFKIEVSNFVYSDSDLEFRREIEEDFKFKEQGLNLRECNQMLDEIDKKSQTQNCKFLLDQIYKLLQKKYSEMLTNEYLETTIYNFAKEKVKNDLIDGIVDASPNFKTIPKLKNVPFLQKEIQERLIDPFENIPTIFKKKLLKMDGILSEAFSKINSSKLFNLFKVIIEHLKDKNQNQNQNQNNIPEFGNLKEYLIDFAIDKDQNQNQLAQQIRDYFPSNLQMENFIEVFKLLNNFIRSRNN